MNRTAVEYKIRLAPDGHPIQEVGPSDHCSRWTLWLLQVIGSVSFLRPLV
ncbi:MAG: hypothetical protein HY303_17955 [Candidatus Wallbacteria bacterium]|nr:hypothetical protein [Candidatus Wallbacteria bacterium]